MGERVYQNKLWLRGKRIKGAASSLEGHDKGKKSGITVKIERNGDFRGGLRGRLEYSESQQSEVQQKRNVSLRLSVV